MKDILLLPDRKLPIYEKLDHFMSQFPDITKDESDFIASILNGTMKQKWLFSWLNSSLKRKKNDPPKTAPF